MNLEILFNIANLAYLIGTLLLTRRVVKNRNTLSDFDFHGSLLNVVGMLASAFALIELRLYFSLLILIPTLLFWMMTSIYSFKNNNRKIKNE